MDNKPLLRARAMVDDQFIAKVICCVDDRLYQWLKQCARATYARETTTALTNFGDIFLILLTNEFMYSLPTSVKTLKIREEDTNGQLRTKISKNADGVVNDEMNNDWKLRPNEQWETVFRHKSVNGPKLSVNCLPYLKYHCKGWCFKDCKNKASHKKFLNDDKSKTNDFIKSLRGL